MEKTLVMSGLLLIAFVCPTYPQTSPSAITKISEEVYHRAVQAVVKISLGEGQRTGAGIVIGKTRNGAPIILTSNALITGFEAQINVQLEQQSAPTAAQVITPKWRNRDLILLAARAPLSGASPALQYGSSDLVTIGAQVSVLGFPGTSFLSQNSGGVLQASPDRIKLSFRIAPGQEGGPVIDQKGRVVGLALVRGEEQDAAVSIDLVRIVVEEWLHNATLAESWQEGKEKKKWYGWVLGVVLLTAAGVAIGISGVL